MRRQGSAPVESNLDGSISWGQGKGVFRLGDPSAVVRPVSSGGSVGDIQRAIEKVYREGGGTVFLRNGVYNETADITLYPAVNLIGEKESSTIINFGGAAFSVKYTDSSVYNTGTITGISGGVTVTGSGTSWLANVTTDEQIFIQNRWYQIAAVTGDTTIILAEGYVGNATFPTTYRASEIITDVNIAELTITGSSADGLAISGGRNIVMTNVTLADNGTGLDFDFVTEVAADQMIVVSNTSNGIELTSCGFFDLESVASVANGVTGWVMTSCETVPLSFCAANSNGSNGLTVTSCTKCLFSVEASGNLAFGMRFVSGCDLNIIEQSLLIGNASDGIEIAATSDRNIITSCIFNGNGAYGVDIAAATCDKNLVAGNQFLNNVTGTINNAGTSTTTANNVT